MKIAVLMLFLFLTYVQSGISQGVTSQNNNSTFKVEWSNSGNLVLVLNQQESVVVIDMISQAIVFDISTIEASIIEDAALSPDEQVMAMVHDSSVITLWDISTGQQINSFESDVVKINRIIWSPDGNFIASSSAGNSHVWDLSSGGTLFSMPSGEEFPEISFSQDGRLARSSSQRIQIWDIASQQLIQRMQVLGLRSSIQWSSDNSRLLVSNISLRQEGTFYNIQILSADTGEIIQEFGGFPAQLLSAQWSPDERQVLSGDVSGTFWITDVASGVITLLLESNVPRPSAAWSPYGGQIAIGIATNSIIQAHQEAVLSSEWIDQSLQIVIPIPSIERLQSITEACNAPTTIKQSLTADIQADRFPEFIAQVEALPADAIPSACRADLLAVAEAIQNR